MWVIEKQRFAPAFSLAQIQTHLYRLSLSKFPHVVLCCVVFACVFLSCFSSLYVCVYASTVQTNVPWDCHSVTRWCCIQLTGNCLSWNTPWRFDTPCILLDLKKYLIPTCEQTCHNLEWQWQIKELCVLRKLKGKFCTSVIHVAVQSALMVNEIKWSNK